MLPQKSTFFYPKLPTGLVFRLLEDGTRVKPPRPPRAAPSSARWCRGVLERSRPRRGVARRARRRALGGGRRARGRRATAVRRRCAARCSRPTVDSSVWCQTAPAPEPRDPRAPAPRARRDDAPSDLRLVWARIARPKEADGRRNRRPTQSAARPRAAERRPALRLLRRARRHACAASRSTGTTTACRRRIASSTPARLLGAQGARPRSGLDRRRCPCPPAVPLDCPPALPARRCALD